MTPNQQQLAIITTPDEQALVIAGAGTGKTKTLVWRIQYLVKGYIEGIAYDFPHDHLLDPAAMVAITFTNIAARQLQERLAALGISLGFVGTLHAYALHSIKRAGKLSQFSGSPTIISEEASNDMIQACAKELRIKTSIAEVKAVLGIHGGRPAQLVAKQYMRKLAATNSLCYDAMLAEFLRLLTTSPLPAPVEALFVDEYQDSAPMDAAIYAAINAEFDMRIGDPDQAIYSFRGGDIRNLLDYGRTDGVGVYHLTTNYRSCSRIVAKANALIAGAPDNPFREFMQAHNASWDRDPMPPDGFNCVTYANPAAEAQAIAETILRYTGQQSSDFAILTRFNAYVPLLKSTLAANGIPVKETRRPDPPRRVIAALRALSIDGVRNNDATAADWLYTVALPGEDTQARSAGRSLVSLVLQRLGVTKTEPIGEALHKMGIDAEGVRLVRDNWQESLDQTADVLAMPDEQTLAEGVHVGTVHSFKGGEAGFVFLAGWDAATCPAQKKGPEFNEERRLAYVGVTRGIFRVEMSYCITSIDSAGRLTRDNTACPFLLP